MRDARSNSAKNPRVGGKPLAALLPLVLAAAFWFCPAFMPAQDAKDKATSPTAGKKEPAPLTYEELQRFVPSFVMVEYHFKRSEQATPSSAGWGESDYESSRKYQGYLDQKRPLKTGGIAIAGGKVLTLDSFIDEDYLDHIEVDNLRGAKCPAVRHAVLKGAPGIVLELRDPGRLALEPVSFAPVPASITPESTFFTVILAPREEKYYLAAEKSEPERTLATNGEKRQVLDTACRAGSPPDEYLSRFSAASSEIVLSPSLILDEHRKPVGVGLVREVCTDPGSTPLWAGAEILADKSYSFQELDALRKSVEKTYAARIPEIKVSFRQKAKGRSSVWESSSRDDREPPQEAYYYGLPVSKTRLLVPSRIQREHAKVIDKILVGIDKREFEGKFAGAYSGIGAFLVDLEEPVLPFDPATFLKGSFPRVTPVLAVLAQRKFGRKFLEVNYDRCLTWERGYKDILEPVPENERRAGTYFIDWAGGIHALLVQQRKEDEEKEMFREGQSGMFYSSGGGELRRVYEMDELRELLSSPERHLDKTIVWLPEESEKRKMWLGVEFSGMSKDLAKAFHAEKPTKDGKIGLVLSLVYPNSPAAKLGLKPGDILLKMKAKDETEPVELTAGSFQDFSMSFRGMPVGRGLEDMESSFPGIAPWPSCRNLITDLLEVIGLGKTVELTYLDAARQEITKAFSVEESPPDFASAPKHKDETVGLTVRNITYEVRYHLMLPEDFRSVVVADIEEGSPAAVARIGRFELVLRIDDADVTDIAQYRGIIENAQKRKARDGKVTLRFTLQQLDKTHFADVTLE